MTPSVSIIIPVLNGAATVASTIESSLAQDYEGDFEVLVVDNGSSDGTREIVERYPVRLRDEPLRGRSRARNHGAREAAGEILAFADVDCVLPRSWLTDSVRALGRAWIGAVQARIRKHNGLPPPETFVHARWHLPFLDTCAMATTRRAFVDSGGFDADIPRNEDMEFSFRLLGCGYALAVLPNTVAIKHHELDYRQALRRGWQDGASIAQVDRKWRSRMPALRRRQLGAIQFWADRTLINRPSEASPALQAVEKTAALAGYVIEELVGRRPTENTCRAMTRLPEVIGWHRSLVCIADEAVLFDAKRRREYRLDRVAVCALASMIEGAGERADIGARVADQLGVPRSTADASVRYVSELLGD